MNKVHLEGDFSRQTKSANAEMAVISPVIMEGSPFPAPTSRSTNASLRPNKPVDYRRYFLDQHLHCPLVIFHKTYMYMMSVTLMDFEHGYHAPIVGPGYTAPKETRKRHNSGAATADRGTKRRTVPDQLRKRAEVSCDLCKKRRVKCVRVPCDRSGVDMAMAPCQNCIRLQVSCESALPRKPRIYGSVKMLGTRYRVLEAVVKHFLPERDISGTRNLADIATSLGIDVSSLESEDSSSSSPPLIDSGTVLATGRSLASVDPTSLSSNMPSTEVLQSQTSPVMVANGDATILSPNQATPSDIDDDYHGQEVIELLALQNRTKIPERLYPNSQNKMSYLGPSSSFKFMVRLRQMLATSCIGSRDRSSISSTREDVREGRVGLRDESSRRDFATHRTIEGQTLGTWTHMGIEERDDDEAAESFNPSPVASSSAARNQWIDITTSQSNLTKYVRETLPDQETADTLVEAFFDRVHTNYVLFHRGTFQLRYEAVLSSGDEEDVRPETENNNKFPPEIDVGWICSIFMVFLFGIQMVEPAKRQQTSKIEARCLRLVQNILFQVIDSTSLSNIQALLLVQLYRHNSCERNSSWMLLGCACRMAISLGIHRDGATGGFDPIERELRRRVWWTMYSFEQQLALTLGRPSAIPESCEVNVGLPNEGMMDGKTYMPPAFLRNSLSLTVIMTKMRTFIAASSAANAESEATAEKKDCPRFAIDPETTRRFLHQLDTWHSNLPPNLDIDWNAKGSNHYRACHLLRLSYYLAKQVLTRSYLLQRLENVLNSREGNKDQDNAHETIGAEFSRVCLASAVSSISIIRRLWSSNQLEGVAWLDLYYAYHSAIVLLVDRLTANQVGQRLPQGDDPTESQALLERREALTAVLTTMREIRKCKTMQLLTGLTLQLAEMTEAIRIDETAFVHHADPPGQAQHTVPALHASQAPNPEMNLSNGEHVTGATPNSNWPSMGHTPIFPYGDANGVDPFAAEFWFEPPAAMDSFMPDSTPKIGGEQRVNGPDGNNIMGLRFPNYFRVP